MPRRAARFLFTLIGGCCYLSNGGAASAQHPNVARGVDSSGVFDVGGIDTVNGFNGNLVIRIPLGQAYPVGGSMGSYSFTLVYNSNVWSQYQDPASLNVHAMSDPLANAGLGWRLSLGRIASNFGITGYEAPANGEQQTYFGPDGSEHYLFGTSSTPASDPAWYSQDGSHLRFLTATQELDFPDGTKHTFDGNGFPTSILDPFGNGLAITYVAGDPPNTDLAKEWDIQDSTGRVHKVYFRPTGYSASSYEQRMVLDHIDLQGFAGAVATYTFLYNDQTVSSDPLQTVKMTGHGTNDNSSARVVLLTRILLPKDANGHISTYRMPIASYQGQNSSPAGFPGPINQMSLPTSGSIQWTYANVALPQPNAKRPWANGIWSQVAQGVRFHAGHLAIRFTPPPRGGARR